MKYEVFRIMGAKLLISAEEPKPTQKSDCEPQEQNAAAIKDKAG